MANEIDIVRLAGGRRPDGFEVKTIEEMVKKEFGTSDALMRIGSALFILFGVALGFSGIRSLMLGIISAAFVKLLLCLIMMIGLGSMFRARIKRKIICSNLHSGNYTVWDCEPYEIDMGVDVVGGASIRVRTSDGQLCRENLIVDSMAAKDAHDGMNVEFILIRCESGNSKDPFYKAYSGYVLNRR